MKKSKYDYNIQKKLLLEKLGKKSELFVIKEEMNSVVVNYLPYNLDFVYIPEGIYDKGLSSEERKQAREINEEILFEKDEMELLKRIHVSDFLVTRTPILNKFVQKYIDFEFYKDEENFAAYLKKEDVDILCKQLNLRLPSEVEWEYFVRAGSQDLFSFGKQLPSENELEKWLAFDFSDLSCVNSNKFGIYGIYVGEWCSDFYKKNSYSSQYEGFVIKGGGAYFWPWQADEWIWCMSAMRMSSNGLIDGECGFRLVYDLSLQGQTRAPSSKNAPAFLKGDIRASACDIQEKVR